MDVLDVISCVFLFMVAGPFLEKFFLAPKTQSDQERTS